MELFKKIDFWIQLVLIICCTPLAITDVIFFPYAYIIVGSWQVFSVLIHLLLRQSFFPATGRLYYCRTLIGVLIVSLVFYFFQEWILGYLFALIFITPGFAVWYVCICYSENKTLEHKAFAHLK